MVLDTFGGQIHVEWDPDAAVTPLGQLPFFIEFLKVSGLVDAWIDDCPLHYQSNNASEKREVLATFLLSILAGHHRYAHITAIREDDIHPELLGVKQLVSEDAARRALKKIDESAGIAWLDSHLGKTTRPLLSTPWILDADGTVKYLYGKQEGAIIGYNYHSALMAKPAWPCALKSWLATRRRRSTACPVCGPGLALLTSLAGFLATLKANAEQLTDRRLNWHQIAGDLVSRLLFLGSGEHSELRKRGNRKRLVILDEAYALFVKRASRRRQSARSMPARGLEDRDLQRLPFEGKNQGRRSLSTQCEWQRDSGERSGIGPCAYTHDVDGIDEAEAAFLQAEGNGRHIG